MGDINPGSTNRALANSIKSDHSPKEQLIAMTQDTMLDNRQFMSEK